MQRLKILVTLLFVFVTSQHVVAGDHFRFGVGGGLNAGYTVSFRTDALYQPDSYSGFFLGPQADCRLTHRLGVDAALFFQKDELSFSLAADDVDITSLQVPINVSFALLRTSLLSLLVEAGPQFSYRLGEKIVQYENSTLTLADYAPSINLGVKADITDVFRVGARVNLPMSSFADVKDTMSDANSFKLSTLQITAAVFF